MANCTSKHIPNPIPDNEWLCPSCGATNNQFYIYESEGDWDCELFHPMDVVRCFACDKQWSLTSIINKWKKKKNMCTCPTCKGTGVVEAR